MSLFDDIIKGAGSLLGIGSDYLQNERNIDLQKDINQQNINLMREGWSRDDTAVSRRAQDLKNAGLSATLAAGSAAVSSSPISVKAPESKMNYNQSISNLLQMYQNFAVSQSEIDKNLSEIAYKNSLIKKADEETEGVKLDNTSKKNNIDSFGVNNPSPTAKKVKDIGTYVKNTILDKLIPVGGHFIVEPFKNYVLEPYLKKKFPGYYQFKSNFVEK